VLAKAFRLRELSLKFCNLRRLPSPSKVRFGGTPKPARYKGLSDFTWNEAME